MNSNLYTCTLCISFVVITYVLQLSSFGMKTFRVCWIFIQPACRLCWSHKVNAFWSLINWKKVSALKIPKKTSVFSGGSLIGLVSCSFSGGLSGRWWLTVRSHLGTGISNNLESYDVTDGIFSSWTDGEWDDHNSPMPKPFWLSVLGS